MPVEGPFCSPYNVSIDALLRSTGRWHPHSKPPVRAVQSRRYKSDMKNLEQSHGSPKFAIKMDRTPSPVGGNEEKLGSICDIIGLWEGMEGKEGGKEEPEGEGGRD